MSRVGKKPIELPKGVTVAIDGAALSVKGPKGELSTNLAELVSAEVEGTTLTLVRADESRTARANHGLSRAILQNMVTGVSAGFDKKLEVRGVGYRFRDSDAAVVD